jgi:predicted RNA-binding Zn-ribbon protein involved in translation (DUF1610 family)
MSYKPFVAARPRAGFFNCPNCGACYHLIKIKAGANRQVRAFFCVNCRIALPPNENDYVLKYFPLGKRRATD